MRSAIEQVQLVIFDCDGVLVDSEVLANREAARVKTELGIPYTTEEHIAKFVGLGKNSQVVAEELKVLPEEYWELMRVARTKAFEEELGEMPGIREVLEGLKLPFCMASSGAMEKIATSLRVTGLRTYFPEERVFNSEMVSRGKPAPDLFLLAAERMSVAAKHCVVIEDSPSGIEGAVAAGMRAFAFTGGSHMQPALIERLKKAGAEQLFSSMGELPGMLLG